MTCSATDGDVVPTPAHTTPIANPHDPLFAVLYAELKRLARREAGRHGGLNPLGATTLLHEAYLQFARGQRLTFDNPNRFLAYAARAMRGLVIDELRARAADKRGGGLVFTTLDTETAEAVQDPQHLLQISDALDELAQLDPRLANIVDLKFFCGFTIADIASQLSLSERTVQRQWEKARALLYEALRP